MSWQFMKKNKDNECEICGRKFGRKGDLGKHVKAIHENIIVHLCDFCDEKFERKWSLKKHVKIVHECDKVK